MPRWPSTKESRLADRFWAKVRRGHGCWEWTAAKSQWGYGILAVNGGSQLAHRVSWSIHFGPIPTSMCVLHHCDNPLCVRPDHLFLGTMGDNNHDRAMKGRNAPQGGESNGRAKLNSQQVAEIRRRYGVGGISQQSLAEEYGVSQVAISFIVRGEHWR